MKKKETWVTEESNVRYRTVAESWNLEAVHPLLKRAYQEPQNEELSRQIGETVRKTMLAEIELGDRLASLLTAPNSRMGEYAQLMIEKGISATALWVCAGTLRGKRKEDLYPELLREIQSNASRARYAKDPKQKAKSEIFELWKLWRADSHRYKSKAAFARDMLDKFECLTSQKQIEDWCRGWMKETDTPPEQ